MRAEIFIYYLTRANFGECISEKKNVYSFKTARDTPLLILWLRRPSSSFSNGFRSEIYQWDRVCKKEVYSLLKNHVHIFIDPT